MRVGGSGAAATSGALGPVVRTGSICAGRMPRRIEDYAIGDHMQSVALVCADGSVDWLCLPRFVSEACFAALLGTEDNGHWRIAPSSAQATASRRYAGDTLILETQWDTADGVVRVTDFIPPRPAAHPPVVCG